MKYLYRIVLILAMLGAQVLSNYFEGIYVIYFIVLGTILLLLSTIYDIDPALYATDIKEDN